MHDSTAELDHLSSHIKISSSLSCCRGEFFMRQEEDSSRCFTPHIRSPPIAISLVVTDEHCITRHHHHSNWVEFIFILSESHRWTNYNLLSHNKGKYCLEGGSGTLSIITRMMISGELRSEPPASRMPQASPADRRLKVTPNS